MIVTSAILLSACSNNQNQQNTEQTEQQTVANVEPATETVAANELQWSDGVMVAVMFLGYYDSFDSFKASARYGEACNACPQLRDIQSIEAKTIGEELYLLIPRDPMASVAVNEYTFDEYMADAPSGNGAILYRSEKGKAILIRCNNSDMFGNTLVNIVDNQGHTTSFSPKRDRYDGSLVLPNDGTIQELRLPMATPIKGYETANYADGKAISAEIDKGMVVLKADMQKVIELGLTDEDMFRIADGYSKIEGLNGICCGVYFADTYFPTLYLIMDNGGVKVVDVTNAILTGNLICSDYMPEITDTKSFRTVTYADRPDEVCAIDSKGNERIVPLYTKVNQAGYNAEDGSNTMIKISSNWLIYISDYNADYNLKSTRSGYLYPTNSENEYKVRLTTETTLDAFASNEISINIERDLKVEDNINIVFEGKTFMACD